MILNGCHINHDTVNSCSEEFESNHEEYIKHEWTETDVNSDDNIGEYMERANEIALIMNERCVEIL